MKETIKICTKKIALMFIIFTIIVMVTIHIIIALKRNNNTSITDYGELYNLTIFYEIPWSEKLSIFYPVSEDDDYKEYSSTTIIKYEEEKITLELLDVCYNFENKSLNDFSTTFMQKYYIGSLDYIEKGNIIIYHQSELSRYTDFIITEKDNIFYTYIVNGKIENYSTNLPFIYYLINNAIVKNSADLTEYIKIANEDGSYKAYNELTEIEKEKYDEIYECLIVNGERFQPDDGDEAGWDEVEYFNAFDALVYDIVNLGLEHYDLYQDQETGEYVANYYHNVILPRRGNGSYSLKWDVENYELTEDELLKFNNTVNEIIENMPEDLSTYGKYRYLADCICNIAEYDYEGFDEAIDLENSYEEGLISSEEKYENTKWRLNSTVSVFVDRKSICGGYAKAYVYLCEKVGLYCEEITDYYRDHAYNLIKLGNEIYFTDVTWMDEGVDGQFAFTYEEALENGHVNYVKDRDAFEMDGLGNKVILGTIEWNKIQHLK